jgi:hypothetical protein
MSENLRAIDLTGDHKSAAIILRIHYWFKRVLREGRTSTAIPHKQFMKETKCTYKEVKSRLAKMRRTNLIGCKQGLFAFKDGVKNVNHYWLSDDVMKALEYDHNGLPKSSPKGLLTPSPEGLLQSSPEGLLSLEDSGPTPGHTPGSPCELHSPETSQDTFLGSLKANPPNPPFHAAEPGAPNMKKAMHVKSVHDVEQAVKANALLHKPASTIAALWCDELHKLTGAYVPPLTKTSKGQLNMFAGKCEPGTSGMVLRHVMKHWLEFTIQAAGDFDLKSTPDAPHAGFLLQYVETAIKVAFPPAPPKQEAPVPKVVPPTMQSIASPVEEYPQTLAELLAITNAPDGE